jgi:hypothetical protein
MFRGECRTRLSSITTILTSFLSIVLALSLGACTTVKLSTSPNTQAGTPNGQSTASIDISGPWQVSYEVNGETLSAHLNLNQNGNNFSGTGTDDKDGQTFVVDKGVISGTAVSFNKRYHVEENPNLPPIVYQGNYEMAHTQAYSGQYMSGSYKLAKSGPPIQGKWDAARENGPPAEQAQQQQAPPAKTGHAPHLSGRWDDGYEFEFKTVRATMYMEQDGNKLTGHGIDKSTKETFTLKGEYKFPNIKMLVKYNAVKGPKGKNKPERTLEFRGTATVVNESEYQGTRLEGKTNGGGAWMAEQVK